jgi:hypothetical protein
MTRKKIKVPKAVVTCDICQIEITDDIKHIERHNLGDKHQRILELILKKGILESWNFQWIESNNTFVCLTCLEPMDSNLSFKKMKRHFKSQHRPFSSSTDRTVEIFKVFQKKNTLNQVSIILSKRRKISRQ